MNYAILLLLGPGQLEINRLTDLLDSIISQEPNTSVESHLVIVNDGSVLLQQLTRYSEFFKSVIYIDNPLYGKCDVLFDRHVAGMIYGFKFIHDHLNVEFVVKMDTDVMCIGSFAQRIRDYFVQNVDIGLSGTFLNWPMGASRQVAFEDWRSRIKNVHLKPWWKNLLLALKKRRINSFRYHFIRREIFKKAIKNGYEYGVHIMGGSYAVSSALISQWDSNGYLQNSDLFERSYLGEDSVMTLLAYAAGFKLGCFNQRGDVFGVWYKEPQQDAVSLKENGYALIHSIKCQTIEDELALRNSYKKLIGLPESIQ